MNPKTQRRRSSLLQSTPVAAAVALLLGSAAHAQQAPAPAPADQTATQTIEVTGIRAAIESAISVKKNADGVVEAISAEDIGKLPDTTIAESLARLPGLTTQRDRNGNATSISIRGLGPDFNGYLLNGREQTSTGDSRGVDLSVYPAELIGGATVYKTGDASLMTAGLAGTIDNHLIDPLAIGHRVIAANVEKTKNGVGLPVTGSGKRYSISYIDQFADRTLGVAIGYVHSTSTSNTLSQGSWGSSGPATLTDGTVVNVSVPFGGGLTYESDRNTDKRDGFAAILNYKPNKAFSTELDIYTAKINTALKKIEAQGGSFTGLTNVTLSGNVVESGTFAMAPGGLITRSENIFDDDKIESVGWKSNLKFADTWSGSIDFNHNKATRVERDIEAYAGIVGADTLSFTNGGGNIPQFTLGNASAYTDPTQIAVRNQAGWSGVTYPSGPYAGQTVPQAGYDKGPTVTDKIDGVRLDFHHDLPDGTMFTDLQFGGNYSNRSKDRITDEGLIISATNGGYDRIPYPGGSYVATNVGGTGLNLLTFDPTAGLWPGAVLLHKYNNDILSKTWTVQEKVTTAYVRADIDTVWSKVPVTGNVGVQLVNTNQSSAGYRAQVDSNVTLTNPAGGLTTNGTTYTDVLPSLNLRGDLGGGNIVRLGLSEQIARPTLTDMRNSFSAAVDTNAADNTFGHFVGSAGNPYLKPFKATALDLSFEKYFGNKAYLSGAAFYKKLDTYITTATNGNYDFTAVAQQLGLTIPPAGAIGNYTTTVNGSGGSLSGVELTASVPFSLVWKPLEGFGVATSYSYTTSSVNLPNLIGLNPTQQVPSGGTKMPLPGLSKTNAKLMLYYERAGFSAFVADNYRSTYVGSVANTTVGGYPSLINIQAQSWVSAQIGYEFQQGALKGLGFRFEGNNMNKPLYKELKSDGSINTSVQTGASYAFKLSYKFE
ncbi:MAG: TonB-dependent receptor [Burkholderiales bacterium]|nr:TonB-dependent receptor [Burkholderiales bacterium]MDE1926609.1 TonB-dependent receptor [Burkholderiales bacterium]MDE2504497.1 TonB-dependent receptor [Burkholderiales bacterium]